MPATQLRCFQLRQPESFGLTTTPAQPLSIHMSKQGVILLNLGSPDSTSVEDVRKYLREFLMDGRVLDAPFAIRWFLVNCLILPKRPKQSAEAYASIWREQGSPLVLTSRAQQAALAALLDMPVALGMRYGNPSTESALQELLDQGVDDLLIIPMYPHYAMSSYETAVVHLMDAVRKLKPELKTTLLPPFYQEPGYIDALVERAPGAGGRQLRHAGVLFPWHSAAPSGQRRSVARTLLDHPRLLQHLPPRARDLLPPPMRNDSGKICRGDANSEG